MCKNRKKEHAVKLAGLALLSALALGIGGTSAVIRHKVGIDNSIGTKKVGVAIEETMKKVEGGQKEKRVCFKNSDSADIFLRASYAENWTYSSDGERELLSNTKVSDSGIDDIVEKKGLFPESDWEKGSDGWYYYKKVLRPQEKTEPILESVDFSDYEGLTEAEASEYQKSDYRLHFQVEAVQASGQLQVSQDAVKEVFGSSISPKEQESNTEMTEEEWAGDGRYEAVIEWTEPGGGY